MHEGSPSQDPGPDHWEGSDALSRSIDLVPDGSPDEHHDPAVDQFAAILGHELRSPLRAARRLFDELCEPVEFATQEQQEKKAQLSGMLDRVDRMVMSLLDYASLPNIDPEVSSVGVRSVLDDALAMVEGDLKESGGEVTVVGDASCEAQASMLARVLLNVLANACHHRRPGVPPRIEVRVFDNGDAVVIEVEDNGRGMLATEAEAAFWPLKRLDPGTTPGLGLGLAICRRLMRQLDGEIRFVPSTPPGAVVELRLPRRQRA